MMKVLKVISLILILAGALNWGLWGFFQFDFVAWLFHGNTVWSSRVVYAIIGLAGVLGLSFLGRCGALCCCCGTCGCKASRKDKGSSGGGCCKM
jgi:uncharacterized protein